MHWFTVLTLLSSWVLSEVWYIIAPHSASISVDQFLCQKLPKESRYPKLMYKRYCLYPPRHLVQRHLHMLNRGCFLTFGGREGVFSRRNLLRFPYTIWAPSILLRSMYYDSTQPILIFFFRVRVLHLDRLKERTWLHSLDFGRRVLIINSWYHV